MHVESIRNYCLLKAAVTESFTFDQVTLVFKVGGKIFATLRLDKKPLAINLKCDPERSVELRDSYQSVIPGYHSNKKHWNTIFVDGELSKDLVEELIDHSYNLVLVKLSKKIKAQFCLL
jgi:predicted DNA-binding protein (MmcQ/YjbR family)